MYPYCLLSFWPWEAELYHSALVSLVWSPVLYKLPSQKLIMCLYPFLPPTSQAGNSKHQVLSLGWWHQKWCCSPFFHYPSMFLKLSKWLNIFWEGRGRGRGRECDNCLKPMPIHWLMSLAPQGSARAINPQISLLQEDSLAMLSLRLWIRLRLHIRICAEPRSPHCDVALRRCYRSSLTVCSSYFA